MCIRTTPTIKMTDFIPTMYADTLVFQLTERGTDGIRDMRLYVIHNYERDTVCVFGRRPRSKNPNEVPCNPFMFEFETIYDAYQFIKLCVDTSSYTFDYALYSMNDLPLDINDFSFALLENFTKRSREICAFDGEEFKKKRVLKYLDAIVSPIMDLDEI